MSDTPRTDAMPWIPNERFVHATDEDLNRFVRKKEVKELERENAALRSELEVVRKDAERYMWLRSQCDGLPPWAETDDLWSNPERLDAAIDAAKGEK